MISDYRGKMTQKEKLKLYEEIRKVKYVGYGIEKDLTIGNTYNVSGIYLSGERVYYLIKNDKEILNGYRIDRFRIIEKHKVNRK